MAAMLKQAITVQHPKVTMSNNMTLNDVTVVTVTYNSAHCIHELAIGLKDLPNLIVVDNASHDHTLQTVQSELPQAQVMALSQNMGFGKANNLALEQVTTSYALLLNPDCILKANDVADLMHQAHQWPDAAIVVPQQVNSSGALQLNYGPKYQTWKPKLGAVEGPACVGHAGAAVWLLRMELMRNVGYFDPDFFLYYEDTDLALRVVNAGLQIVVVPTPQVVHVSRGSVGGKKRWRSEYWRGFHHAQSKIMFARKHANPAHADKLKNRTLRHAWGLLLLRALFFSPKHLARAWGRINGLMKLD